jgi:small multidrug resistance family-3 protein
VPVDVVRAIILFGLAGLAEISGGWLVWQWLRESKPWPLGLLGAAPLSSQAGDVTAGDRSAHR